MADYSVLQGYDGLTGEPIYDTIWVPDEVYPPAEEPVGGGEPTPTDNTVTDTGTGDPVVPVAEPVVTEITPDPTSGQQPTGTSGGGEATLPDNTPTEVSTIGSVPVAIVTPPTETLVTPTTGYNTPTPAPSSEPTFNEPSPQIATNPAIVTATPVTQPTTVSLVSGTGTTAQPGQYNTFHSGDTFNLTVTGTPGQPVYVVQNGGAPFLFGYVGADGTFVAPPTKWDDTNIGTYTQAWIVGQPGSTGANTQTIKFAITGQGGGSTTITDNHPGQPSSGANPGSTVIVTSATAGAAATPSQYGNFQVGDQFTAKITGKPGDPVYVTQTKNGTTSAPYYYGVIGPDGIFIPPYYSWGAGDAGVYSQTWAVGSQTTTVNFRIDQPIIPDDTPTPPPPPQPGVPLVNGTSVETNQNTPVSFSVLCSLSGPGVRLGGSREVGGGGGGNYGPVTLSSNTSGLVVDSNGYAQFGYNSPFTFNIANQPPGSKITVTQVKNGQVVMTNQPAGTVGANGSWTAPDQNWDASYQGDWQQIWNVVDPVTGQVTASYPMNFSIGAYDSYYQPPTTTESWRGVNITGPRFGTAIVTNVSYSGTGTATITFQYTPNLDFVGWDYFEYTTTDSNYQTSSSATINIHVLNVIPAPNPPTVSNSAITVDQNYNVVFTFQTGNGAQGITQISGPRFGKIEQVSGFQYRYTPNHDYAGSDSISFRSYLVDAYNRTVISQNLGVVNVTVNPLPTIQRPDPIAFTSYYSQASNIQITGSTATLGTGFPDSYNALLECITDNAGTGSTSQLTSSYVKNWQLTRSTPVNNYHTGVIMSQYNAYFGDTTGTIGANNDNVAWFDTQTPAGTSTVSTIAVAQYPTAYDFNFSSFTAGNTAGALTFNGTSGIGPGDVLRLTPSQYGVIGTSYTTSKFPISRFNTFFQLRFSELLNGGADGIVFAIQPGSPTALGGGGGGMGYSGVYPSVGVKFDIYYNNGMDQAKDFVAVVTNGDISTPVGGQIITTGVFGGLSLGSVWSCWLDYDGATLDVYLAENSTVKPVSPGISVAINIPAAVGSTTAYLGFTAATGASGANQDILSWTWQTNNSAPEVTAPVSRLYTGYFRAPVTDTYTFTLQSDDACYVWMGDTALSGYTKNNALVKAGGVHTINTPAQTNTIALTAGSFYPIRVAYGNYQSTGSALILKYSTSTIGSTSIPASQLWHLDSTTPTSTTQLLGNYITVVNGDQIAPVIMSPQAVGQVGNPNFSRILTYRVTLTGSNAHPGWVGQTTTFQVGTTPVDLDPDAFAFTGADRLELSTYYTTNTITLSGLTPGIQVPVKVDPTAKLIINGVNTGVSTGTIQNGQTLAIQALTASTYLTPRSFTVTVSGRTSTFIITTRPQEVCTSPWYFGDRTGLELSTRYQTANTFSFGCLEESATISVSSGNVIVNGVDLGVSSTTINHNDAVAFNDLSSASYGTTTTHIVTLYSANAVPQTQTDTFSFTTRTARTVPVPSGAFVNQNYLELETAAQSNTLTFINFDITVSATLSSSDGTAYLIKNGNPVGTSTTIVNGDTLAIAGTTATDYYTPRSYTLACGPLALPWQTRTKSNDDLHVLNDF